MSDPTERRWLRQMADEAKAIASQQIHAGDRHSPVKGPEPHADVGSNALVKQSLRDCAQLLDDLIQEFRSRSQVAIPIADLQELVDELRTSSGENP